MQPIDFILIAIALSFLIVLTVARLLDVLPSLRVGAEARSGDRDHLTRADEAIRGESDH
jgi:hypothetical protein